MASRARIRILMPDSDAASIPRRLDYLIRLPGARPLPGRAPETPVYSTYAREPATGFDAQRGDNGAPGAGAFYVFR